jgi:uncharacterized protein
MNQITLLVELQRLDTTLDENAAARAQLESKLADTVALDSARGTYEEADRSAATLKAQLRSLELETSSLSDKLKQVSERLYSGRITNAKELAGLNQDEKMLARRKSELEDQSLVLMEKIETAEKISATNQSALKKITGDTRTRNAKEHAALAALDESDADLTLRRDAKRRNLPPETLRIYDDLRKTKKGRAVVGMKHDACAACGTQVPSGFIARVKAGTEPVFCTSCGRILSS